MVDQELIEIGYVRAAHGLKGHVIVHAYSHDEDSLTGYGPLLGKDGIKTYELTIIDNQGTDFKCRVKGVEDRTAAELLRGTKLFTTADKLPPAEDGEYYIRDLIGLNVVDENGAPLGRVADIFDQGVQDSFDIEFTHNGKAPLATPQREYLLFIDDNVKQIDLAARRIVVCLPDGFFEEPEKD